ncbi:MAG: hypothetical protein CL521_04400 [Actinobacteria bacterium]|nr:hypothetical protein [Actinomycetota bacterium]|tara:strand:- start:831 stop:1097 length:267 start_codon:yes stop_codon:yes gene_type:complete
MSKKEPGFFDRPETQKKLWVLLWSACILTMILELSIYRKSYFGENSIDGIYGFYAIVGFLSCIVTIIVSKGLGIFLKVKEGYYDDDLN